MAPRFRFRFRLHSFGLVAALLGASAFALVNVNCASPTTEEDDEDGSASEADLTGVNNVLGLGLRYDATTKTAFATLKAPLKEGEKLHLRVRRGLLTRTSEAELNCDELTKTAPALTPSGDRDRATGKVVFRGPKVDRSIFDLVKLYDDARWATDEVPRAVKAEVARLGPDAIVEACLVRPKGKPVKLQTSLANAWDEDTKAQDVKGGGGGVQSSSIHFLAGDGGGASGEEGVTEENVVGQIKYGQLCVKELGEIPFFPKTPGAPPNTYDTFDCRDLVGTRGDQVTGRIDGVEGAMMPVTINGVAQDKCTDHPLGLGDESYSCMGKADHGMYLDRGGVQPGPMAVTATGKDPQGNTTHWLLLCRKISDDGSGMTHSKVFNDIAMIGHNPKTGRTCFFQNDIGNKRDGRHVPHPGDESKSPSLWSESVQSYCSGECHAESAFVHSPWIDGAKRANGKTIVPKIGEHDDFPISRLDKPYNIVAGRQLGFKIPQQLVSDEVGACNNCHRLAGKTMGTFADWATGTGDVYYNKITDHGKKFAESHWMPPRITGLPPAASATDEQLQSWWRESEFGKALEFMKKCESNASDPSCIWADVPRGAFNNPPTRSE